MFYEDYFDNSDIISKIIIKRNQTPFILDREFGYCGEKRIVGGYGSFSGGSYTRIITGLTQPHIAVRLSIKLYLIGKFN